jgi:BirA family biotin operon repressor/biotin-[acetyl-CoA-carboxylase] ligase
MKMVSGRSYDIDAILESVLVHLKMYMNHLKAGDYKMIKSLYETELFRIEKPSTFQNVEGVSFTGFIKGVSNSGYLQVLTEDDILKEFDLKQVRLLY